MNHVQHLAMRKSAETGMGRFFSGANLDRYRRLADYETAAAERNRVFKALAGEWNAFTRECGKAGAARVGSLQERVEFRRQHSS
jgi:hypothetical protein